MNWIEDWKKFIIVVIFSGVIVVVLLYINPENPEIVVSILTLFFTLIGTLLYATALPTVSLRIMSGKKYYNSPNMPNNLLYDTRVYVQNLSRFPAKAYLNLNLKVNGKPVPMGGDYCGKEPWHLYPYEGIDGHFNIDDYLKNVGTNISKLKSERTEKNTNSQLRMTIEVRNAGPYRYLIEYPTRHWHFDLEKEEWYNEDFGYYA